MKIKQHLKMGMIALSLFLFNIQFSHAQNPSTCGPDKSFGSIECHCCIVGSSGPTSENPLYTKLMKGDHNSQTNACKRCGEELAGSDGACAPNACPTVCYGKCSEGSKKISPK